MRKKWIRATYWLAGTFLLLIILFTAVLYFNQDKITGRIVTEINALLEEPVEVGSIEVSLRKFPLASIKFEEVFCKGAAAGPADTLVYAEEMFFEFHLWKVLFDDLSIDRISLARGTANIFIPATGKPNYEIWKSDTSRENSGLFTLERVYLNDFKLQIQHGSSEFRSLAMVDELIFTGAFGSENYQIESSTGFHLDSLLVGTNNYLAGTPVTGSFKITGKGDDIFIENGAAKVDGIPVSFSSEILADGVKVQAENSSADLEQLLRLVKSQQWAKLPKDLRTQGRGKFHFTGEFPNEGPMELQTSFETAGGSLSGLSGSTITNLAIAGKHSRKDDIDHLVINSFSGNGNSGTISGALSINNLSHPKVVLDLKSNLELQEWLVFVPLDTISQPSGRAIVDLHLENRFNSLTDIRPAELKRTKARGTFKMEEVAFAFKGSDKQIQGLNADLLFDNNSLKVSNFFFKTGKSDIYLEGLFGNVMNYIFLDGEKLVVNTSVRSKELHMEDFILGSGTGADEDYNLDFVRSLDLDLHLKVDRFSFESFSASDISGELTVQNGIVKGRSLKLNADDGSFAGNFSIDTRPQGYYNLSANLWAKDINMHELFVSFDNFGQEEIIADNIYGTATADLRMTALMQPNLEVDVSSVDLAARLAITNGNLKDYEPMMALSKFANIEELKDVHFDHLENDISIKNSEIIIPKMDISSNVMNLAVSGRHRFDNSVDYSMQLKLSDVLFSKRKSKNGNSEFDQHIVEVRHNDDPNIHIRIMGPAADPRISLDRQGMERSISEDLKEQGKELKNILSRKKDDKDKKDGSSGIKYDLFGEEEEDAD